MTTWKLMSIVIGRLNGEHCHREVMDTESQVCDSKGPGDQ